MLSPDAIFPTMNPPPDDLNRFVAAQHGVHDRAVTELRQGRKANHWMWFVFPQLRGLGSSDMATTYGLVSAGEALHYWQHPILGARLAECTALALAIPGKTAHAIFGSPDDLKFWSCMTLFGAVAPAEPMFAAALARFFGANKDPETLRLLQGA